MKKLLIGIAFFILLFLWSILSFYPDWLWFENLGFFPVFWTMIKSKFGFGLVVWALLILVLAINILIAQRSKPGSTTEGAFSDEGGYLAQIGISGKTFNYLLIGFILIVSFIIAQKGSAEWDMVLRYLYQVPFGTADPIFNRDIGFYIFSLPFYRLIQNGLVIFLIFAGLLTLVWYLKVGLLQIIGEFAQAEGTPPSFPKIILAPEAKKHIIFLVGIIVLLLGWGYYLKGYELLYSTQGTAFGASFTDIHTKIWAYRILIIASLVLAVILISDSFKPRGKFIWISGGVWVGAILLLGTVIPVVVQKLIVKPNELTKEATYIAHNIKFTRMAYNLNEIKVVDFDVRDELTAEELEEHSATIQNIRVWDERPLLQTYRQIQAIRLYYDFNAIDVDRYMIDGRYRQIMLGARELVVDRLSRKANTWVNRHLTYTHGYGLASSPVNEVTEEGLPQLLIKDLPPNLHPDMRIDRPEIYYGEKTAEYVLVKTKNKEFDYPKGSKNVYTTYQGNGGVLIKSFIRRLLFAIEFLDAQILFTGYLTPESRIMYNRRIERRVAAIAPFLDYDQDPYLVVSGGRLYWIIDAYTTSNMYPYSTPSSRRLKKKKLNYIRNSVKAIVDAYDGSVSFYFMGDKDPIARTYKRIFPDLFKDFNEMPEDLKKHIRYPRDLFDIQVATYRLYHMDEVQVFYNQEDLWEIPDEMYGETRQEMKPYYIIVKLPNEKKEEFLLMLPFTPAKKDNMIGWLAARSDLPHYGSLLVYKLPKEKLVYGPMQIEARVDQQTEISRELSLWGQRGSRVIRGNLLAIPIGNSFLYVEPVYLEARQEKPESETAAGAPPAQARRGRTRAPKEPDKSRAAALPELKRVIVSLGNRLFMEETLEKALSKVLGERKIVPGKVVSTFIPTTTKDSNLADQALEHYIKAKNHLRQGNWAEYGREIETLEKILKALAVKQQE